jgi:hypothetical protein
VPRSRNQKSSLQKCKVDSQRSRFTQIKAAAEFFSRIFPARAAGS